MWIETESGDLVNLAIFRRIAVDKFVAYSSEPAHVSYQARAYDVDGEWIALSTHATETEARATVASIALSLKTVSLRPAPEPAP